MTCPATTPSGMVTSTSCGCASCAAFVLGVTSGVPPAGTATLITSPGPQPSGTSMSYIDYVPRTAALGHFNVYSLAADLYLNDLPSHNSIWNGHFILGVTVTSTSPVAVPLVLPSFSASPPVCRQQALPH
eukprot:TRINITY_DN4684_c0_g1_i1.p1 TRINITY_DN4684_c0_g1~~TRINITY_DN4684_c0_g1_i1.p1  ORF type:complete len:130 (+),score=13.43 TRINITY_DN4684_c0_g1_i1:312-701(+)